LGAFVKPETARCHMRQSFDMDYEQLSDSSDSLDSPRLTEPLKLPKQRQWQDWSWLLITLWIYYAFFSISQPAAMPQIPQLNGNYHILIPRDSNHLLSHRSNFGGWLVLFDVAIYKSNVICLMIRTY
jgi:hypothetical protein